MATKKIEPTPETEVERLRNAATLLDENPLWQEVLAKLEEEYMREWRDTSPVQQTQRENAYFMVQAINRLGQQIKSFTAAGALHREHTQANVKGVK